MFFAALNHSSDSTRHDNDNGQVLNSLIAYQDAGLSETKTHIGVVIGAHDRLTYLECVCLEQT